jgi:hypothetical protein
MKLTDVEVGYLKMCLRMKLNKDRKGLIRLSNKFGDAFDLSHPDVESLLVRVETGERLQKWLNTGPHLREH